MARKHFEFTLHSVGGARRVIHEYADNETEARRLAAETADVIEFGVFSMDVKEHPASSPPAGYELECYSCGLRGTTEDFGLGLDRQCPSCQSYEVHSPDAGKKTSHRRLEYLRDLIHQERISWGELAELQGRADEIHPSDVELLEWAGVPEFPAAQFLDPAGVHVGDTFDGDMLDNERIIAYGQYTDGLQAVITLMPRHAQAISSDRPTYNGDKPGDDHYVPGYSNYCTFLLNEQGERIEVQWHSNIAFAVQRYTQEMGMDV